MAAINERVRKLERPLDVIRNSDFPGQALNSNTPSGAYARVAAVTEKYGCSKYSSQ